MTRSAHSPVTLPLAVSLALLSAWLLASALAPALLGFVGDLRDHVVAGARMGQFPWLHGASYRQIFIYAALFSGPLMFLVGAPTLIVLARLGVRSGWTVTLAASATGAAASMMVGMIGLVRDSGQFHGLLRDFWLIFMPQGAVYGALSGWMFARVRHA